LTTTRLIRQPTQCAAAGRRPDARALPGWRARWFLAGFASIGLAAFAPALEEAATPARLASRALLLDVAQAGGRIVAVGERGHILISTDSAQTWRQAPVPTRHTLTGVAFGGDSHVLAVGHAGTLLRSSDAGESWVRVDAGIPEEDSFLDVMYLDPQRALAVGAYGLFLATEDGGATWERRTVSEDGFHLNRIARDRSGAFYLAGEAGTVMRSLDSGGTWELIPTPYEGSFFGFLDVEGEAQLIFGLRGHVFRSETQGDDWEPVELPVPTLVMSGAILGDGRILLAGQSGNFLVSSDSGHTFELWKWGATTGVAELLRLPDGALLVLGEAGAARIQPPPAQPTHTP
jgi:photosystem II stability/assembly factor-like uncharacterized protein